MIIVRLMGGLGNQMFQYAIGYSLAKKFNTTFKVDESLLNIDTKDLTYVKRDFDLNIFNLSTEYFEGVDNLQIKKTKRYFNKLLPLSLKKYYIENNFDFNNQVFSLNQKNIMLEGYWQSYKYFQFCNEDIYNSFRFSNQILENSYELQNYIINSNSVCLNVRRADFVSNSHHGTLEVEYYIRAIKALSENSKNKDFKFFIFSDDINWCKSNLNFIENSIIVDHSHKGVKFSNYLQLMTLCKNFIIPNSSFAWWAAWLSKNTDKIIICPKIWFLGEPNNYTRDLIPNNWIRI